MQLRLHEYAGWLWGAGLDTFQVYSFYRQFGENKSATEVEAVGDAWSLDMRLVVQLGASCFSLLRRTHYFSLCFLSRIGWFDNDSIGCGRCTGLLFFIVVAFNAKSVSYRLTPKRSLGRGVVPGFWSERPADVCSKLVGRFVLNSIEHFVAAFFLCLVG
jgi:hypothetical protein